MLIWYSAQFPVQIRIPIQIGAQPGGSDLEKEEGVNGYEIFAALSQTVETEWSRLLLTWWAGLDLNQQCFRCSGFTDRLLQPICIPTHVVTSAGFEPGIAAVKGLCPDRSDEEAVSAL